MKYNIYLYKLIKSLTKDEKARFTSFAARQKGNKDYLKVYKQISIIVGKGNAKELEYLDLRLKRLQVRHVSGVKRYLYEQILKAIRPIYDQYESRDYAMILISEARILSIKGLIEQCKKKLDEAKELAYKFEKHLILIEILKIERGLCLKHEVLKIEEKLEKINQDILRQINLLQIENTYRHLQHEIVVFYRKKTRVRNKKRLDKIKQYLKNPYLRNYDMANTFFSKVSYFSCLALLALLLGEEASFEDCLGEGASSNKFYKELLNVWLGHPHFKEEYPTLYIIYVSNYLVGCHNAKDYSPFPKFIKELEKIKLEYFNEKAEGFQNLSYVKQLYFMNAQMFDFHIDAVQDADILVTEIAEGLDNYGITLVMSRRIALIYNNIVLYFALKQYNKAQDWINKFKELGRTDQQEDIQLFARLMHLLILTEQGAKYLEAHFKAFDYHLKKNNMDEDFEGLVTKYLKTYTLNSGSRVEIFKELKEKIKKFRPFNLQGYEVISIWIESRIQNKSFFEILRDHRS